MVKRTADKNVARADEMKALEAQLEE